MSIANATPTNTAPAAATPTNTAPSAPANSAPASQTPGDDIGLFQNAQGDDNGSSALDENSTAEIDRDDLAEFRAENGLIHGKYKDIPAALKAQKELQAKLSEKFDVPEAYATELLEEHGLSIDNDEQWEGIQGALKEAGVTAAGYQKLIPVVSQILAGQQAAMEELYGVPDQAAEYAKLQGIFGNNTQAVLKDLHTWSKANMPDELFYKPLNKTAAGVKFSYDLMMKDRGNVPANTGTIDNTDTADLDMAISDLINSPDYYTNAAKQKKLDQLVAKKVSKTK